MKTLKKLTLIAVVTTLFFACADPFQEGLEIRGKLVTEESTSAEASAEEGDYVVNPIFEKKPDGYNDKED